MAKRCPDCGGIPLQLPCLLCKARSGQRANAVATQIKPKPKRVIPPAIYSTRYCQWCGEPLERKWYKLGKETLAMFAKRRFCNSSCAGSYHYHSKQGGLKRA